MTPAELLAIEEGICIQCGGDDVSVHNLYIYKMPLSPTKLMLGICYAVACTYAINAYI